MSNTNWANNRLKGHVYEGKIDRSYENLPCYSFDEPGKKSYTKRSKRTIEELQKENPKCLVRKVN